jgi:hypothetical protein
MHVSISEIRSSAFVKDFLNSYCSSGFGTLSKREIDLLVLKLLLTHGALDKSTSPYHISRQIQMPLTKVKVLLYELNLRDESKNSIWLKDELNKILKYSKLTTAGKDGALRIEIGIDNQLIRTEVEAILKNNGYHPDYSFNREILRLTPDAYLTLIEFGLQDSDRKEILSLLEDKISEKNEGTDKNNLFRFAIKQFISHSTNKLVEKIGDMSVEGLKAGLKVLLDNGSQLFV